MSPNASQQWTRRIRYGDQHIRVSDAERNAVVERLGQHYADGRLDQAEFDERVNRAMAAKTRGDLAGLFDDLPEVDHPGTPGAGDPGRATPSYVRARRGPGVFRSIIAVAIVFFLLSVTWHAVTAFYIPWVPIAIILLIAVLVGSHHHHR